MPCNGEAENYCVRAADPNPYLLYTASQLLEFLKTFTRPDPGPYSTEYSNLGFALLGYALERITHQSFDELVKTRITIPLHMNHTVVARPLSLSSIATLIKGFNLVRQLAEHWQYDCFAPAAGLVSTIKDLMLYLKANITPPHSALGRAIKLSQNLALGWDSQPGATKILKNGESGGFSAMILLDPGQYFGSVALANIESPYTDYIALSLVDKKLPDLLGKEVPDSVLASALGSYASTEDANKQIWVTKPGKFLSIGWGDGDQWRLSAITETKFDALDSDNSIGWNKVSFKTNSIGKITGLVVHFNDDFGHFNDETFVKMDPRYPTKWIEKLNRE